MFVHALSGAASFAACLRLFRSYPLAVSPWSADGRHRSIVLRYPGAEEDRVSGKSGFFILSQDRADHFVLRPWAAVSRKTPAGSGDSGEFTYQEIRPVEPVPAAVHRVIAEGMPVPRDGALLGWVSDRQAMVLLSVYHGRPRGPLPGGPADPGAAAGRQRAAALARVHREPARRRAAVGVPGPGRAGRSRPGRRRRAGSRVLGAVAEPAPRQPRARLRRHPAEPPRRPSSGCPRASTWTTGCCARASPRPPRATCSGCLAPSTWPAG